MSAVNKIGTVDLLYLEYYDQYYAQIWVISWPTWNSNLSLTNEAQTLKTLHQYTCLATNKIWASKYNTKSHIWSLQNNHIPNTISGNSEALQRSKFAN